MSKNRGKLSYNCVWSQYGALSSAAEMACQNAWPMKSSLKLNHIKIKVELRRSQELEADVAQTWAQHPKEGQLIHAAISQPNFYWQMVEVGKWAQILESPACIFFFIICVCVW